MSQKFVILVHYSAHDELVKVHYTVNCKEISK